MIDTKALGTREVIGLVAGREIRERVRARSFAIVTALLVIVIIAVGVISRLVPDGDDETAVAIGVAATEQPDAAAAFDAAARGHEREVEVTWYADTDAALAALDDGDVDVVVSPSANEAVFDGDIDDTTLAVVQQAWMQVTAEQRLTDAGLDPAEVQQALGVDPLRAVTTDGDADDDEVSGLGLLVGTASAVLLFMALQTFGTHVLTGVVEEKSSAVVEVLLVRARADQLLAGKVIGIGTTALIQVGAALAATAIALAVSGASIPGAIWGSVPMMLVWFLGGFTLYSTLFALAGSLVSRQEDAQSAAAPIAYALIAAYVVVFIFGYVPSSVPSIVLSMLPPTAPFLMPMRMAAGAATVWQVAIAVAGLAAATFLAWKTAGRIYEQVLLRRGSRITWRDALGLARR